MASCILGVSVDQRVVACTLCRDVHVQGGSMGMVTRVQVITYSPL